MPKEIKKINEYKALYILIAILVFVDVTFIIGYGITAYIVTRPAELSGSIECNSGKLGIDYQTHFNSTYPYTNIPTVLNLKGIDNLNCKAEFHSTGSMSNLITYLLEESNR